MARKPLTAEQKALANARAKRWRAANPQRYRELDGRRREKNPEKKREHNRVYGRKRYAENPSRTKAYDFKRKYGITLEQRDAALVAQGNRCASCKTNDPGKRGWHTDHCHTSLIFRGVLCRPCNLILGLARDNAETLRAAAAYLESFQGSV